jgi:PTS system nitrogen regulatory IIA component
MSDEDILTLREVASYLKVAEKTVLRLVHRQELPSFKVASQWRFKRSVIDEWIMTGIHSLASSDLSKVIESDRSGVPLSRLLSEDFVVMNVKPGTKDEVLKQLIEPILEQRIIIDGDAFLAKLMQREELVSTAVGGGIALPHLRYPRDNPPRGPFLTIGVCPEGTDFGSLDGLPTRLFILVCADRESVHLRIMARLSLFLRKRNTVERIISSENPPKIVRLFVQEDTRVFWEKK